MASLITSQRVQRFIQSRFNPMRSLTPEFLSMTLDSFEVGYLREFALIAETMEQRDPMLKIVAPKRKKAVARHGYEIVQIDDSATAAAHKQTLEYFYGNLTATNAINANERGGFKMLVKQMSDAIGKRFAVHEIVWQPGADGLTAEFKFAPLWFFENRTGVLRYLPQEGMQTGVDLLPNEWLVTTGDGIMIACAIAYMFKSLPLKDLLIYCERFGMPIPIGETSAAQGSAEWRAMELAVENLMAGAAAVKNTGENITLLETKNSGQLPHPKLVDLMDRYIAALWRGADLSSLSGQGAGANSGASLQGEESDILELDDTETIGETLQTQVSRFVINYEHGDEKPLAYIRVKTTQRKDLKTDILVDQFLLNSGFPLSVNDVADRYERSLPEKSEVLLKPLVTSTKNPGGDPSSEKLNNEAVFGNEFSEALQRGDVVAMANALKKKLRAGVAGEDQLMNKGAEEFADAQKKDFAQLAVRLPNIFALPEEQQHSALFSLRQELPAMARGILRSPKTAPVLADTMTASFFNGYVEAAEERKAA